MSNVSLRRISVNIAWARATERSLPSSHVWTDPPALSTGAAPGGVELRSQPKRKPQKLLGKMVLQERIELSTSPLPRECSTTELLQQTQDPGVRLPAAWRVTATGFGPTQGQKAAKGIQLAASANARVWRPDKWRSVGHGE